MVARTAGHPIVQAISCWFPIAAARVRAPVWPFVSSPSTSVSPANLHSTNCSTISIIWGWYNRPVVAAVPNGLSLTPLRIILVPQSSLTELPWHSAHYLLNYLRS
jgi:hypothetical protein